MDGRTFGFRLVVAAAVIAAASPRIAPAQPAKPPSPGLRFDQSLALRAEGKRPADDVRIDASWRRGDDIVKCRVYGSGIGIWRDKTQFSLTPQQLQGLLKDIAGAHLGEMPAAFGNAESDEAEEEKEREKEKEKEKEHRNETVYLNGMLSVRVGTDVKRVAQYLEGDQNAAFAALVARVLDTAEKAAAKGVGAPSLAAGLAAIADGKLAPPALQVFVQSGAGRVAPENAQDGWVLRLDGRRILDRTAPGTPRESARVIVLSDADFRSVVALLRENDLSALPHNLYADGFVRLDAQVLDHRTDLTARRYAGKTASSLGAKQEAFDRVYASFLALHERARKEGTSAPSSAE